MPREGIDYAWHHGVDTDAFRQGGATFVVRYVSHDESKNLSAGGAQLLSDAGFDLAVVWESTQCRAREGNAAGAADAHTAAAQAKASGMPANRPVYFAVDFDASDDDLPGVVDYLAGAASVLGRRSVGVYGGYRVVGHCLDQKVAQFAWQTYAWSAGRRDPRAQLYQHRNGVIIGGVSCDRDTAFAADFGQWRVQTAKAPPFPYPAADYLGTARPDPHCHSGTTPLERQHIARWQKKMAERGWRIDATGVFNRQSERVCIQFQTEKALAVDGLVGPKTWRATWTSPVS
jgi:peptidoglycan hydrolase-like protein with peptidoglycan-binding domain